MLLVRCVVAKSPRTPTLTSWRFWTTLTLASIRKRSLSIPTGDSRNCGWKAILSHGIWHLSHGCFSPQTIKICEKFYSLFRDACASIELRVTSRVFDLSTVFLSIRNIATCFSLGVLNQPDFSRSSALRLGADSIQIQPGLYRVFERARILCTRGQGAEITNQEAYNAIQRFGEIDAWMKCLIEKAGKHARI